MAVSQSLTVTEVANSTNVADNTSQVNIKWTSTQSGDSYNAYTRTAYYWISINGGEETKYSVSYTLPQNKTKTILNKTITVPHKSDGSGTVTVRTEMDTRISAGVVKKSAECILTTIPRATTMDSLSCSTAYFTGTLTYKYTPKTTAFYNRCNISLSLDGEYINIKTINHGKKTAAQQTQTVTLSSSELSNLYSNLTKEKKGTLRFTFRTYSDSAYSDQIGSPSYKEVTLSIPNNKSIWPLVSLAVEPVSTLPAAFDGLYIQGKTKLKATVTASGQYGADITLRRVRLDGVNHDTKGTYTSGYLSKYGTFEVTGYVEDSRGFSNSVFEDITVIAYAKPKILDVVAARCDEDGNLADNGTYLKIIAKRSYSPVKSEGVQKNFCQIRYRYKVASASTYSAWTTILDKNSLTTDQVETGALLGGVLSIASTYHVQVQAIDDIGEYAETVIAVPTDIVHNHKTKNGWGFGKYCEGENLLDCAWDAHFHGEVLIGDNGMTLREYILAVISEGG